jgi:hypothetical protein
MLASAEVARLEVLSAWAVVHSSDPTEGPDGPLARRVGDGLRHLGGEGTPGVQDFCLGEVGLVDSALSRMIATEAAGRVLEVAEAKIIEADTSSTSGDAMPNAGDAVAVAAIVHRVADIIAPRHPEAFPEELRALAFGWLARPAELFTLLLEHAEPAPDPVLDLGLDEPEQPAPARALAFPADLLDALREVDLRPLAPRAVLHVHLHARGRPALR